MFENLPIQHPQTPPTWINEWPSRHEINALFTQPIRQLASTLAFRLTTVKLDWNDKVVRSPLGTAMCTWIRLPDGNWNRQCTCQKPNRCVHQYMTFMLLQKVFEANGWLNTPSAPQPPPVQQRRGQTQLRQQNLPLSRNTPHTGTRAFFNEDEKTAISMHTLQVEVDFKHEPGMATLRFYDFHRNNRSIMNLNAMYNLGALLQRQGSLRDWNKNDQDFIAHAFQTISKIDWRVRNLEVLKLRRDVFAIWQERWRMETTRFIERSSQEYLQCSSLATPTNLVAELALEKDTVRINASFLLPGDRKIPVHTFFKELEESPEREAVIKKIKEYQPPIPWKYLAERYASRPPVIKRSQAPQELATLLNGRLDILQGETVRFKSKNNARPELKIGTEYGYFYLEARIDGSIVPLTTTMTRKATVTDMGTYFLVNIPNMETAQVVQSTLCNMTLEKNVEPNRVTMPISNGNALKLKMFCEKLPDLFQLAPTRELKKLIGSTRHQTIKPVITVKEEGPLAMLDLHWDIDDLNVSHEALARAVRLNQSVMRTNNGAWIDISLDEARKCLETIHDIPINPGKDNPVLTQKTPESIAALQDKIHAELDETTRRFLEKLAQQPPLERPQTSNHLNETLRSYQREGIDFLIDRTACKAGTILADDMGLGKTLQVIATLDAWKTLANQQGRTFQALVVSPASVMRVWKQQAELFCPNLTVEICTGTQQQRHRRIANSKADILVTHYQLARIDKEAYSEKSFDFLVLDEAQAIKNPEAQVTLAIKNFNAEHAIALTGTPIENSALDLWSIMHCINPGFLKSRQHFVDVYMNPIDGYAKLKQKIKPLILRRTKNMVAKDLPPRTEQVIYIEMSDEQRQRYEQERARIKLEMKEKGPAALLGGLTRLRELCCHPELVDNNSSLPSAKMERLVEQLQTLHESGHATLVFSQFTSMLDLIKPKLDELNLPYLCLTGETSLNQRETLVQQFQNSETPMTFLLSLKAAGTGLTLTRADYVILFDPWWNPAAEQQAIDRTHRIGQEKPVVAYRYITANTVEEKVYQLLESKRELFNAVLKQDSEDESAPPAKLTAQDLRDLID